MASIGYWLLQALGAKPHQPASEELARKEDELNARLAFIREEHFKKEAYQEDIFNLSELEVNDRIRQIAEYKAGKGGFLFNEAIPPAIIKLMREITHSRVYKTKMKQAQEDTAKYEPLLKKMAEAKENGYKNELFQTVKIFAAGDSIVTQKFKNILIELNIPFERLALLSTDQYIKIISNMNIQIINLLKKSTRQTADIIGKKLNHIRRNLFPKILKKATTNSEHFQQEIDKLDFIDPITGYPMDTEAKRTVNYELLEHSQLHSKLIELKDFNSRLNQIAQTKSVK